MDIRLKKLEDQVIVITGASSGIGLTTARLAARRGAKLVLAARNGDALQKLADELNGYGTSAVHVVADVSKEEDVRTIASTAIAQFGGFDTWINNAGVSIFGKLSEISLEDQRRIFDINFWGVVHGSLVAAEHFKWRGGALINLGSELSDCGITLQGIYAASKHAVKGFTDSLRMELEEAGAPVSVTLIKPAAVDTMFLANAKNYMEVEPKLPAPIYAPEVVAEAILFAAEHPKRDIFVGSASKLFSSGAHYFPQLMDRYMKRFASRQQRTDKPANSSAQDALYWPGVGLQERLGYPGHVCESSLYTRATTHPKTTGLALAGAGLALAAVWQSRQRAPRNLL
ncbi:SDR family oxidoreductase [Oxalobacteraceae bacterium R-40]|uniref:SDR family oxidoreductase n=1 Tax=Keguizhuia sedimenti TaxID=3064264 RepID=A0ABU1BKI9_9BURK|nr:SDR family oxidoreductase [Oxalobacteraceae bacterium R-40]